jgi:peptidoglycan/LPS O-acetylase OafA/YrhL
MSELRALTGARGLAAWVVVLYHIRESIAGLPVPAERVLAKGYLAVDFFFLLSGFVIWLTWGRKLHEQGAAGVPRFWQKRIARVWPLHALMLAFGVALAATLALTGRSDPAFPFAELPLHLVLIQNWGLTDALRWNNPAWSISCEAAAYLLFPLLACRIDWRRLSSATLVAIAAALLLGLHLVMRGEPSLGADIPRFGVVRCLAEFGCGTIVAALYLRRPPVVAPLAIAGVALAAWALGATETLTIPAAFAALLLVLALTAGRRGHPLAGRLIHYLGDISYATYLSHYLLWKAFKLAFVTDADAVSPLGVAAYLLLVLAASVLLYHCWERPAQRLLNRAPPPMGRSPAGVTRRP